MEIEKIDYILKYYNNLLSVDEINLLDKFDDYFRFKRGISNSELDLYNIPQTLIDEYNIEPSQLYYYNENSLKHERANIARAVLERNPDLTFNTCPVCHIVRRTPVTKQCKNGHRF
ncbi:MAG TPA: hypothetical protein VK177_05660 [Flavobacteriales bacterium]|nr:hypothetical protein [Flavobacteriales bacterium]